MPRPHRTRTPDLDFQLRRDQAETVPCPDCHAHPGQTCTRPEPHTGRALPLTNLPAHLGRTRAAESAHTQEGHQ